MQLTSVQSYLERLFGSLAGVPQVEINGSSFDIFGLPMPVRVRGEVLESKSVGHGPGTTTQYRVQLAPAVTAELTVTEPPRGFAHSKSFVRGTIRGLSTKKPVRCKKAV